jgi:hypothetical protein
MSKTTGRIRCLNRHRQSGSGDIAQGATNRRSGLPLYSDRDDGCPRTEPSSLVSLPDIIRNLQEAVDATPSDHLDQARHLYCLGLSLCINYARTAMADLGKAMEILQETTSAMSEEKHA